VSGNNSFGSFQCEPKCLSEVSELNLATVQTTLSEGPTGIQWESRVCMAQACGKT